MIARLFAAIRQWLASLRKLEDPLACLPDRGDGAAHYLIDSAGRRKYIGAGQVPFLRGKRGQWNGYNPLNDTWEYSYGLPNDCRAWKLTVLYRSDKQVGFLWFYRSPSHPKLNVLFVFTDMAASADPLGAHMGHHRFVWHGTLLVGDL